MPKNLTSTGSHLQVLTSKPSARKTTLPPMPPSIPASMKKDFQTLVTVLMESGTWHMSKMPIVETYFTSVSMLRAAAHAVETDGRYYRDDKGNMRTHPAGTEISKATAAINTSARLLGLNTGSPETVKKAQAGESASTSAPSSKWSI